MAKEKSNYEKLQECSQQVSKLIELEKLYREGMVPVDDLSLQIPTELIDTLLRKFREARIALITTLNSIHQ